jgi:hypothetical protein
VDEAPDASVTPSVVTAGGLSRLLAGVGGAVLLLFGSLISAGAAFAGVLGLWLAAVIARSRRRELTRLPAWFAAAAAVTLYAGAGIALLARALPEGTFEKIKATADSASAEQRPPAWLERMSPGTSARMRESATTNSPLGRGLTVYGVIVGIAFMLALYASLSWSAAMLLTLGFSGRWTPGAPVRGAG